MKDLELSANHLSLDIVESIGSLNYFFRVQEFIDLTKVFDCISFAVVLSIDWVHLFVQPFDIGG